MANKSKVTVTKANLVPYIEKEGKRLADMLSNARMKLGARYNPKNSIEQMYAKFGNPKFEPEKFFDEYMLIIDKKSQLPASIRYTVRDVCLNAHLQCAQDMLKAQQQAEAKTPMAEEKKPAKKTTKTTKKQTTNHQ